MIYTAIYQGAQGKLTYSRHTGHISRKDTWLSVARQAAAEGECLIALVPGDHPIYFYENFVDENTPPELSEQQRHDLYEINYQVT